MQYIKTSQAFNNYPVEFLELSHEQEQGARAEFDRVEAIEKLLINEGNKKNEI